MGELVIRPLELADLPAVASIHIRAFPESAITAFGDDFVVRYYRWLLESQTDAVLAGAFTDDRLAGFCAAGVFRNALNGFLRKERARIALHLLRRPRLFASPLIRDRIRSGLAITVKFSKLRRPARDVNRSPSFGVLAIATAPDVRGSGAGRALMLDAENRARTRGFERMSLTVHPSNARAIRFYEGLGWEPTEHATNWNGRMVKTLRSEGERA